MDSYRVPKEQTRVVVSVPPRQPEEFLVFLSPYAASHSGAETLHDLLSRPEAFIPLVSEARGLVLTRKDAVRWILVVESERAEGHFLELSAGAPEARVRVEYQDGESLEGTLRALTPEGERRVLDIVNRAAGFMHLAGEDGLYLVNLSQIMTIGIMEERRGDA